MSEHTNWIAAKQDALAGAIRFLKQRCILVDVYDRKALVRRYRVSGIMDTMLAIGVIEYAVELGFGSEA